MSSYSSRDYGRSGSPEPPRKRVRPDPSPSYMEFEGPPRNTKVGEARYSERPEGSPVEDKKYNRGLSQPPPSYGGCERLYSSNNTQMKNCTDDSARSFDSIRNYVLKKGCSYSHDYNSLLFTVEDCYSPSVNEKGNLTSNNDYSVLFFRNKQESFDNIRENRLVSDECHSYSYSSDVLMKKDSQKSTFPITEKNENSDKYFNNASEYITLHNKEWNSTHCHQITIADLPELSLGNYEMHDVNFPRTEKDIVRETDIMLGYRSSYISQNNNKHSEMKRRLSTGTQRETNDRKLEHKFLDNTRGENCLDFISQKYQENIRCSNINQEMTEEEFLRTRGNTVMKMTSYNRKISGDMTTSHYRDVLTSPEKIAISEGKASALQTFDLDSYSSRMTYDKSYNKENFLIKQRKYNHLHCDSQNLKKNPLDWKEDFASSSLTTPPSKYGYPQQLLFQKDKMTLEKKLIQKNNNVDVSNLFGNDRFYLSEENIELREKISQSGQICHKNKNEASEQDLKPLISDNNLKRRFTESMHHKQDDIKHDFFNSREIRAFACSQTEISDEKGKFHNSFVFKAEMDEEKNCEELHYFSNNGRVMSRSSSKVNNLTKSPSLGKSTSEQIFRNQETYKNYSHSNCSDSGVSTSKRFPVSNSFNSPDSDCWGVSEERCFEKSRRPVQKKKLTTKSSYKKVDENIKVKIIDSNFRDNKISSKNFEILEKVLTDALIRTLEKPDAKQLEFRGSVLVDGNFKITCCNEDSFSWLQEQIKGIGEIWEGAKLKLIRMSPYKKWKTSVLIPDILYDPGEVLLRLHNQNPMLRTNFWSIYHHEVKFGKQLFIFGIDYESIKALEALQYRPFYYDGRVTFRVPKKCPYVNEEKSTNSTVSFTGWINKVIKCEGPLEKD